jgi:large subunit ribosomal protein L15e
MAKGLAYYLRQAWKKPNKETLRQRMIEWRAGEAVVRVENPLRIDRAHSLGYKAKKGVFVVRVRVIRGGHRRPRPKKGRMGRRMHTIMNLKMNYQQIAEQRAARKYPSCEVLNSYWIGKDGMHFFYEVILVDRAAPEIKSDKQLGFVSRPANNTRIFRGLTSAASKARGLRNSNFKVPKVRPSLRANDRQGN